MRSRGRPAAIFLATLLVCGLCDARAEDTCLPAPNERAPHGSHWYYRTDPSSQNKCWHLRTDEQIGQPQPFEQSKSGSTETQAAADPPLPRPAPNALRRQRSNSVPKDPDQAAASGVTFTKGPAQGDRTLGGGYGTTPAWPLPPAFATNPTIGGEAPTGIATSSATFDGASPQRGASPGATAADIKAGCDAPADEKQDADQLAQEIPEPKSEKADKETIAANRASYEERSYVIFLIIAAVIAVGVLTGVVIMKLARALKAAAVIRRNSAVRAHSEKADPNDDAVRALRELIHLLEPYEASLSTRRARVNE